LMCVMSLLRLKGRCLVLKEENLQSCCKTAKVSRIVHPQKHHPGAAL
jgi:hypothetical protein